MTVAFIGLGEVGGNYSRGMVQHGGTVKGYDLKFHDPDGKERFQHCADAGVGLVAGPQELIEGSDIIIAVTSSHQAMETAEMYRPYLKPEQIYVELNSATPKVKKEVQRFLEGCCVFVDGATMNSPTQWGVKTPVVMSGPQAKSVVEALNAVGMNITLLGNEIGQAAAYKVIRSIFAKSVEASLMESMCMARKYGIADEVFHSMAALFEGDVQAFLAMMIRTNMIHAKRRAEEVEAVGLMEQEDGMNNIMAMAAAQKLFWLAGKEMKEKFNGKVAQDMYVALDTLLEVY